MTFEGEQAPEPQLYDRVLMAVGRRPNGTRDRRRSSGRDRQRTRLHPGRQTAAHQRRAYLRHRRHRRRPDAGAQGQSRRQGRGRSHRRTQGLLRCPLTIPSVAYTDPEIAWMGLTETQAKAQGIDYEKGKLPLGSSRARALPLRSRRRHDQGDRSTKRRAASWARASSA